MRRKGEATSHYIYFVSMYLESPSVNHIYLIMVHQALQEHHLTQKSFESLYQFVAYELSVFHLLPKDMSLLERVISGSQTAYSRGGYSHLLEMVMELCLLQCSPSSSSGGRALYEF